MKVLVTGGAGFVGRQIVKKLMQQNYEVVIIDNLYAGFDINEFPMVASYIADIRDSEKINKIFEKEKPEIVIHAAAQVKLRDSVLDPINDAMINIIGTLNVLEACRKNKTKKIIYISTIARVGEPQYLPVDEKHPVNPLSPYGISKHSAEHYIEAYNKLYGLDYLIFCFGNVYGPGDNPSSGRVIAVFIDCILRDKSPKIFGDGEQTRDFLYLEDLAEFVVESMNKTPKSKFFHLAHGEKVSINHIFNTLKSISGFNKYPEYLPAMLGEIKDIHLDIKKVREELDWQPKTSIEEGLRKTLEWFKNKNN